MKKKKSQNRLNVQCMGLLTAMAVSAAGLVAGYWLWNNYRKISPQRIEYKSYDMLRVNGKPVAYFSGISNDSILKGLALQPTEITQADFPNHKVPLKLALRNSISRMKKEREKLEVMKHEIDYYMNVHDVQDEGYDVIIKQQAKVSERLSQTERLYKILSSVNLDSCQLDIVHVCKRLPLDSFLIPKVSFRMNPHAEWSQGRWMRRERISDKSVGTDIYGRLYARKMQADSIAYVRIYENDGAYCGQVNSFFQREGHGSYIKYGDGTVMGCSGPSVYQEGHWENDRMNGFGFSLDAHKLKAGEWKSGIFKGERLLYTSDRIYGIDISKYQHGKGRKTYPIQWSKLRIRHLGHISKKRVTGVVDYPISFIYIKATEGTTVRNRFYATDYHNARKHGYRCGAYHFFSTRTSGSQQAAYFLRNARFSRGDMPPVLDVEPTHAQIVKMGGTAKMFASIRHWMAAVRNRTGVKPILYVSQTFVNRYLNAAPDIKKDYNIWIARYGEYKPDVHLVYWQLSPDGRVTGMQGEVDINVFNGYRQQFVDFVSKHSVR